MEHLHKNHRRTEDGFVTVTTEGKNHDVSSTLPAGQQRAFHLGVPRTGLCSALQRLTPRECVIFEGLSRPEMSAISVIVSSSEEAVKTSFFRATRKMCAALVDSAMNSNFETETDSGQICRNLNTKKGMDTCKYIFSRFQLWNLREQRRRFD